MRAVPMAEFEGRLSEYVSAAGGGQEIVIMHDGQPVARLMPPESREQRLERQDRALRRSLETREQLRAQGVRVTRDEIREWIDEGRP